MTRELTNDGVITISVGSDRIFRIREKKTKNFVFDLTVSDSDLYWMKGDFQKHYTHEIPKQKKIKTQRISLTFRHHTVLLCNFILFYNLIFII
jgi:alkylated DNA repair dioxygenase AlkB